MAKRLIVCLDGTWKTPETEDGKSHPSNVLKFMRALRTTGRDGQTQVVYYDRGVGSDNRLDKLLGGAFGWGLSRNVLEAYRWVANNYEPDQDRLYFLGFSRGAYTARSLAGLIGCVGLMGKHDVGSLPYAYGYYRTKPGDRPAHKYHETAAACPKPAIAMIGVFDTVGSLGVPVTWMTRFNGRFQFHNVELGRTIENAFQALAVDEFRKPFAPAIWETPDDWRGWLEQAWFAGAHTNVGGGYRDHELSDITLLWMVERAERCGLDFDRDYLDAIVTPEPRHDGWMGNEYKGFWSLFFKPYHRKVCADPPRFLTVHDSVVGRHLEGGLAYAPENVENLTQLAQAYRSGASPDDRSPRTA